MAHRRLFGRLIADERGVVAATYALALFALVAIIGVGYDYTRLVTVDTEMQNAADQAALAAATQLDGKTDAITRARNAVNNYFASSGSTLVNRTLMANDGDGTALSDVSFTFYEGYDSATDTFGDVTAVDADAKVVQVTINARQAFFALTPIVGALTSGTVAANAVAGLDGSICKLPPIMVCGPPGATFPTTSDIGKGLYLKQASSSWFPGNFGYVDFGNGGNTVKELMGTNKASDACVAGSDLTSEPGVIASATDYLNTRFDIYTNPLRPADCATNGDYCPSRNTRKDLVIKETYTYDAVRQATQPTTAPVRPACGDEEPSGSSKAETDWTPIDPAALPVNSVIGFPRDTCHLSGTCAGGLIGDKIWNIAGYQASHPNVPIGLTSRYQIYKWERDNPGSGLTNELVNTGDSVSWSCNGPCNGTNGNSQWTAKWTNYCSYPNPLKGTYHATAKDRRIITVAVVDCTGASGKSTLDVTAWMDIFLTEPSWDRTSPVTSRQDIYGEIADVGTTPLGGNGFQYYSRNKAVLLR